jgi:hypothetical protein
VEVVLRKERSEGFDDEGVNFAEGVKVEMALREEEEEAMESGEGVKNWCFLFCWNPLLNFRSGSETSLLGSLKLRFLTQFGVKRNG